LLINWIKKIFLKIKFICKENTVKHRLRPLHSSGLVYFGARYYDVGIGRFITPDPLGMIDGPNMYLYCGNEPVNLIDVWGLCGNDWEMKTLGFGLLQLSLGLGEVSSGWGILMMSEVNPLVGAVGYGMIELGLFTAIMSVDSIDKGLKGVDAYPKVKNIKDYMYQERDSILKSRDSFLKEINSIRKGFKDKISSIPYWFDRV